MARKIIPEPIREEALKKLPPDVEPDKFWRNINIILDKLAERFKIQVLVAIYVLRMRTPRIAVVFEGCSDTGWIHTSIGHTSETELEVLLHRTEAKPRRIPLTWTEQGEVLNVIGELPTVLEKIESEPLGTIYYSQSIGDFLKFTWPPFQLHPPCFYYPCMARELLRRLVIMGWIQ